MSKVIFDISMSLDGFMTAANQSPQEPMGEGGQRLHEWASSDDDRDRAILTDGIAVLGAVIAGRTTYDTSLPGWGADGPSGPARRPVFVVSHSVPEEVPQGGVYTFVTDGIESALDQAANAAGSKYVVVMGGAQMGQQFIRAGLVEELSIHLAPVLLGTGTRMFEGLDDKQITLELLTATHTPNATHLRFRIAQ